MLWLKIALSCAAFIAWSAIAIPYAQAQEKYTLTVTPAELATIGKALEGLPYKDVAQLMAKLQGQVAEQQKPQAEAPKAAK